MKSYNYLYPRIYSLSNLILAWREARKHKTRKDYIIEFEKGTMKNLLELQEELKNETYFPEQLKTFFLHDPKTRRISKSAFRDRIIHHALVRVIEPIFERLFIYDSCANRKGKGNLFALQKFDTFKRKVSRNNTRKAFCLKADIRHYFQEVNHEILLKIIERKINDKKVTGLIEKILRNGFKDRGMPLGNLTSQFFANVYLNELDYFVKHKLRARYYIRYVDDFIILNKSKSALEEWKLQIDNFLKTELRIRLHPEKSRIVSLSRGIDFVGFRNFYYHRLLRKRNIRKMLLKIDECRIQKIPLVKLLESFQGWNAYAKWANSFKLRRDLLRMIKFI